MWKRFLEGTLNFIMAVGGIVVVIAALVAMGNDEFLTGLIILVVGGLFVMLSCSGLGILVEIAYHLEAIERNTSGYQGESNTNNSAPSKTSYSTSVNSSYSTSGNTNYNAPSKTYSTKRENPLLANSSTSNETSFGSTPWECSKCGCENASKALFCEKCGNKK